MRNFLSLTHLKILLNKILAIKQFEAEALYFPRQKSKLFIQLCW